jgi:hypothetical protein
MSQDLTGYMPEYRTKRNDYLDRERLLNDTPNSLYWLLKHLKFDDPILCLSFLAEQRINEPETWKDLTRLQGWMVTTFDTLRRAGRTPDLPTSIMAESASTYVIDYWLTLIVQSKSDPRVVYDAKPPTLAAYLHVVNEMGEKR